jgi:xylan 1,4-beta-xylosidase
LLNFTRIDLIYDGLLDIGVYPFIELGFMPEEMAETPSPHPFWYHRNVAPPRDPRQWYQLIYQFARHLVERYGIDQVADFYFEVWNEPNLDFWTGEPKEETYYELYDVAAAALKDVDERLRVGCPATAQAAWVDRFIQHCADKNVPVDFVSTHIYPNDIPLNVFGKEKDIPQSEMLSLAVRKVYQQVKASARPQLPIIWSEYKAGFDGVQLDSPYVGAWLANNIRLCAGGLVTDMSYWTFTDAFFEEGGVFKSVFTSGFGLIATGRIPKSFLQRVQDLAPPGRSTNRTRKHFGVADAALRRRRLGACHLELHRSPGERSIQTGQYSIAGFGKKSRVWANFFGG